MVNVVLKGFKNSMQIGGNVNWYSHYEEQYEDT